MGPRVILVALVLAAVVGVPFLDKAFTIDDTFVLTVSKQILREPLRPYHGAINWGDDPMPIPQVTKNPPLLSYYLAPFVAGWGYSEQVLHGAMILFLVLLALGAGLLGRWFWVGPWWPMAFVMLSPLVVVSSNVMRDVPAAGLLTLGLALFVQATDDERWGLAASGAVLVGLAAVTKYSAAALIPVMGLYPILHRKWRYVLWVLVPVAILGAWCLQGWLSEGTPDILLLMRQRAEQYRGWTQTWQSKGVAGLTIVGSMLFLLPVVVVAWLRKRAWLALPLIVAAGVAGAYGVNAYFGDATLAHRPEMVDLKNGPTFVGKVTPEGENRVTIHPTDMDPVTVGKARIENRSGLSWQYYLWATTGAALLAVALVGGLAAALWTLLRRQEGGADWVFVLTWLAAPIAFSVVFTPFQAARHFLPALAPLTVVVLRLMGPRRRAVTVALAAMLAVQAGVAGLVAFADAEHAEAYRKFADYGASRYQKPGQAAWFNGHWGFQHYALEVHGMKQFAKSGPYPPPGAILLQPTRTPRSQAPEGFKTELVEEKAYPATIPARTMDSLRASFYSETRHLMPYYFTFEKGPVLVGQVLRVTAAPQEHKP